jgi:hypothetical protein
MYQRRTFNEADKALSENIRAQLESVEALLMQLPPSRNRSLALTHLEDTMLRANLAITEAIALREEA